VHDEPIPDGPSQRMTAEGAGDALEDATTRTGTTPRKAAMDLLARREHSARELCSKLSRRFPRDAAACAVAQLGEEGLQSDERFAESFARERFLRAYGPRRIRAELQQRGVSAALIGAALSRVVKQEGRSWADLAREALQRRFGSRPSSDLREKARRQRFLYQRGFEADVLRGEGLLEGYDPLDHSEPDSPG